MSIKISISSGPVEYVKLGNLIVFAAHLGTQRLVSYDPTDILYHSNEGMHWSISPSLPEGLSLDSSTGKITGIPTEVIDWTDYTVNLSVANSHPPYYYNFTFDFKLQVLELEQLYPLFPSEDSADFAIIAITSGTHNHCVLLDDGTVSCWGRNSYGNLGDNTTNSSNVPIPTIRLADQLLLFQVIKTIHVQFSKMVQQYVGVGMITDK